MNTYNFNLELLEANKDLIYNHLNTYYTKPCINIYEAIDLYKSQESEHIKNMLYSSLLIYFEKIYGYVDTISSYNEQVKLIQDVFGDKVDHVNYTLNVVHTIVEGIETDISSLISEINKYENNNKW